MVIYFSFLIFKLSFGRFQTESMIDKLYKDYQQTLPHEIYNHEKIKSLKGELSNSQNKTYIVKEEEVYFTQSGRYFCFPDKGVFDSYQNHEWVEKDWIKLFFEGEQEKFWFAIIGKNYIEEILSSGKHRKLNAYSNNLHQTFEFDSGIVLQTTIDSNFADLFFEKSSYLAYVENQGNLIPPEPYGAAQYENRLIDRKQLLSFLNIDSFDEMNEKEQLYILENKLYRYSLNNNILLKEKEIISTIILWCEEHKNGETIIQKDDNSFEEPVFVLHKEGEINILNETKEAINNMIFHQVIHYHQCKA